MSTRKLYVVSVEAEMLVVASSAEEAKALAIQEGEFDFYDDAYRADEMTHIPAGWDLDSIPFGLRDDADPDRTVRDWIEKHGAGPTYSTLLELQKRRLARAKPVPPEGV